MARLLRARKAQVELQFNWLYVLVAGGFILLLFFGFVFSLRSNTEQELSVFLKNNLFAIMDGARGSADTLVPVSLLDYELTFSCDEGFSSFGVEGSKTNSQSIESSLFSPQVISGEKMYLWSKEWFAPYKIDNMLYVSSPKIRYVLVYADAEPYRSFASVINGSFPKDLDLIVFANSLPAQIADDNYDAVKLIFLGFESGDLISTGVFDQKSLREGIRLSGITVTTTDKKTGTIEFLEDKDNDKVLSKDTYLGGSLSYIDEAMVFAAIFSDSYEHYECGFRKLLSKMKEINAVHEQKADLLRSFSGTPQVLAKCSVLYDNIKEKLGLSSSRINDYLKTSSPIPFSTLFNDLTPLYKEITVKNNQLEDNSCPLVY